MSQNDPVPHIILTRFGIGVTEPAWLERKLDLFEAITHPSISRQADGRFYWLIGIDADMPTPQRTRLERLLAISPQARLLEVDRRTIVTMQQGTQAWLDGLVIDAVLGHGLVEDPTAYVLTSIIDDDDAWSRQTTEVVQRLARQKRAAFETARDQRPWLVAHSAGIVITFRNGIWFDLASLATEPHDEDFASMSVFVMARLSSGITALSARHKLWSHYHKVVEFEPVVLTSAQPMRLYTRHDDAISNAAVIKGDAIQDLAQLEQAFGVDAAKITCLHARPAQKRKPTEGPRPAWQVLDLSFRIAARNRQINALKANLKARPELALLIERAEAEREWLLDEAQKWGGARFTA